MLADQFGVYEAITKQLARHRDERASYRRLLRIVDKESTITMDVPDWYSDLAPPPPDEHTETALDILQRILGAHPVPAGVSGRRCN